MAVQPFKIEVRHEVRHEVRDYLQRGVSGAVNRPLSASGYPVEDFVSTDSLKHGCAGDYRGFT